MNRERTAAPRAVWAPSWEGPWTYARRVPPVGPDGGDGDLRTRERRALARPLADEIVRGRLIDMLAERWNVRLVAVVAPGGYGKSTALAQAIRDNDSDPTGIDAYARCRASQLSAADIANDLLASLGAKPLGRGADGVAAVAAIDSAVADASPNDVCLHLDDVHLLADIEGGEAFLDVLLNDLPFNGHLVIAGRSMPAIKTSRLVAADQMIEIGLDGLRFDDGEVGQLAERHGASAEDAASAAGWPALSRLALVVGPGVARDYLLEEVLDGLTASQRLGIAAAVVAGSADASLLADCGCSDSVSDLIAEVPLLVDLGGGAVGAHDLWQDVLVSVADSDTIGGIVEHVVDRRAAAGAHYEAVDIALAARRWDLAEREIHQAIIDEDADLSIELVDRWIDVSPPELNESISVRMLMAFRLRMIGDFQGAAAGFAALVDEAKATADIEVETTVCWQLGVMTWFSQEPERLQEIRQWSKSIIERGGTRMAETTAVSRVGAAEMRGDFAAALKAYQESGVEHEIALRHSSSLAMLIGDSVTARAINQRMLREFPKPIVLGQARYTEWQCGEPDQLLEVRTGRQRSLGNHRNDFLMLFFDEMIGASLGEPPAADEIARLAWGRSRERTFVAIAHAARDLIVDDEDVAADAFERRLVEIGLDDPLLRGEVLRFLPYSYVLSPSARTWIDESAPLGPLHLRTIELAKFLLRLRTDPGSAPECPAGNGEILTWLPLPWSIEIAVRLAEQGSRRGYELAEYLADVCGARAHVELRRLAAGHPDLAVGATAILSAVPAPPAGPIRIDTANGCVVADDGPVEQITRLRVRQVMQILAVRSEVQRSELIEMVWPGIESSKARPNLRATLLHLRRALEPGRQSKEASFHVRLRGERLWLQRSGLLSCDVWETQEALDAGQAAASAGRDHEALEAYRRALALWQPGSCPDVRDIDSIAPELRALDLAVQRAGSWAAERLLSQGEHEQAAQLAGGLLERDRYDERAHDIVIGAHLVNDDLAGARRSIDVCMRRLAELGVRPGSGTSMLVRRYERRTGGVVDLTPIRGAAAGG